MKCLLSFFVPAAMLSLALAGCSDYDNGYDVETIKFNEAFHKAYGDIDPEQDWNLAERGTVTVSTQKESEVKIYALRGNEYVLVGHYEGVRGSQELGFDMVEGTQSIMVTDGVTAQKTTSGGSVEFGGTRTIYIDKTGDIEVEKIPAEGITIKDVDYPQYKFIESADYDAVRSVVPEIGSRQNHTNLNRVTHDFSYISNGEFVIYPYFWNTSSNNTIGVYYTDADGVPHEVDIYQNKGEGLEGQGEEYLDANLSGATLVGQNALENRVSKRYWSGGTNIQAAYWQDYTALVHGSLSGVYLDNLGLPTDISDYKKLVVNADLKNGTDNFRVGIYEQSADGKDIQETKIVKTITTSGEDVEIDLNGSEFANFNKHNCKIYLFGSNGTNHINEKGVTIMGIEGCKGDIQFKKVQLVKNSNNWSQYNGGNANDIVQNNRHGRSQGIVVRIPEGTKFGMYLKKTDGAVGDCTFYSESSKNNNEYTHGHGIIDYGNGTVNWDDTNSNPSYASTFTIDDQMFIGFEDWPNNTLAYGGGDFDLNDIVLAFDGSKPTIINEEADSWLMVCEDLGGSFDTDYNDVIFKVEHVSGETKAKVTAMAAGGTLASYIVVNNQVVGEIHQMFGAEPKKSGTYAPINATSRYEAIGSVVTIDVPADFTMSYSTEVNKGAVNMGGFEIRTLKSGDEPAPANATVNDLSNGKTSVIAAPEKGSAPYMLCLPYTYTKNENGKRNTYVWAWPVELCTICSDTYENGQYQGSTGGAYLDFGAWVSDYTSNRDWYMNPNTNGNGMTVETLLLSSQSINGENGGNNQKQPSPLTVKQQTVTWTVGQEFDMSSNITTSSNGAITYNKYHFAGGGGISEGDYNEGMNGNKLTPNLTGRHTISITQAETDEYYGGTVTYVLNVVAAGSSGGSWTTLTNLGAHPDQGGSSYTIAQLLTVCGSASQMEIQVEDDNWNTITLIAMLDNEIQWDNNRDRGTMLESSSTTITVNKTKLQEWQNAGYNKVLMTNPSSSVQARPVQ